MEVGSMKLLNVVLLALFALVTCAGCVVGDYTPRPVVVAPAPVVVAPAPVVVAEPGYYYSTNSCYGCWYGWYGGRYGYHRWH
jgi:hypothetical protein